MAIWDEKDVAIVQQALDSVGPDSFIERARLIVAVCAKDGITMERLQQAIEWWKERMTR